MVENESCIILLKICGALGYILLLEEAFIDNMVLIVAIGVVNFARFLQVPMIIATMLGDEHPDKYITMYILVMSCAIGGLVVMLKKELVNLQRARDLIRLV
ncbi:hypothetical protein QVD17_14309 [Tagetes erecta]|uniref:Uncharacterized protein n=1 Tax=Tagetes erecta TaxID=13708 RepID=A0AAD8P2K5_TARER|nr:hypothetical protein QVD17_14309 [Tagetes erecta]